jgi:histidinol dehydrogenase
MSTSAPIARLDTAQADFEARFRALLGGDLEWDEEVERRVRAILADVRARGDAALIEHTARFDERDIRGITDLVVPPSRLELAYRSIPDRQRAALEHAAQRIRRYHERQRHGSWSYVEEDGTLLGQEVRPLDRVGIYAPGGKAAYPSSVLMGAIPAIAAGVAELVLTVPAPRGELNELVLAAARVVGVERVLTVGGAQAIGALAYGTETVPRVDKIVGPGNAYVAMAKRLVFGVVGIEMIAGPSEIVIVADGTTSPEWVAMDMCSQAEHDEAASAMLLSPVAGYLEAVEAAIVRLLPTLERRAIIDTSLRARGALIKVRDLDEAIELVNRVAPEHLELSLHAPDGWLSKVRHAGAIFLGSFTSEVLGDYCAGPNHVLPTASTARFSSPLGVYDFQKRSSVMRCTPAAARRLGATAAILARGEGLTAHARSAELRMEGETVAP